MPDAAPICTTGVPEGADRLLVGFVLVRGLLLAAKYLFVAAMQPLRLGQLSRSARALAKCCCIDEVPNVSVRPWGLPLQAEFVKFGAKVHEGGDWDQPLKQAKRVK